MRTPSCTVRESSNAVARSRASPGGSAPRRRPVRGVKEGARGGTMGSPTVKHRSFHAEAFEGPVQLDGAAVAGTVAAGHRRLPGELGGGRTAANGLEHRLGATGQDVVAGLH